VSTGSCFTGVFEPSLEAGVEDGPEELEGNGLSGLDLSVAVDTVSLGVG